jgi:hypothetical protein
MSKPTGRAFAKALEEAGVVSDLDTVERIVIDIDATIARVYVQRIGDSRLLEAISGPLGMMLADVAPKGVRYWTRVANELLDDPGTTKGFAEAGLRIVEHGGRVDPHVRMVLIEDDGAPPELDGKEVEISLTRGYRHAGDLNESVWVSMRQVIA